MPIDSLNPQYDLAQGWWARCRDAYSGTDAIHAAGTAYLPRLGGQKDAEYDAYQLRAAFFNSVARTTHGLVGSVFRRPFEVKADSGQSPELPTSVTLDGETFGELARQVVEELVIVGRVGVLVDLPKDSTQGTEGYCVIYRAEQIINWRTVVEKGKRKLSLVVLREQTETVNANDPYEVKTKDKYRVLSLKDGFYNVRVYEKVENDERTQDGRAYKEFKFILESDTTPKRRGVSLASIPFTFVGPSSLSPVPEKPPLLDLVDVALSHYRTTADLEHGRHFTALPQFWISGFDQQTEFLIGSARAWVTENTEAKAGILEFQGQGLGALEKAIEQKEQQMAVLGARMLEPQRRAVETAETARIRSSGETASLQELVATASSGLTKVIRELLEWVTPGAPPVTVALNKNLLDVRISHQEIVALMSLWQADGISRETMFYNLYASEIIPVERTFEEEQALIRAGGGLPALPA